MFSSTGVFRDISCPYFIHGLCERPYCHFKHSRTEEAKVRKKEEEAKKAASNEDDVYTVPTSSLQKTLANIEQSIKFEKKKLHQKPNASTEISGSCATAKTQPTGTPKYNPTPLHRLEKQKLKGKSTVSKYDIALLKSGPTSKSEYDPASNYSTSGKSSSHTNITPVYDQENGSLPDYAKTIKGVHEDEEDSSALTDAKIPEFVSVDYTPSTFTEFSDDESVSERHEASENESEKSAESNTSLTDNVIDSKDHSGVSALPIEFTADGFVKSVLKEAKSNSNSKKILPVKPEPNILKKTDREDNIFNLFKEEFDKELNTCIPSDVDEDKKTLSKDCSASKIKFKRSSKDLEQSHKQNHTSVDNMKRSSSSKHKESKKESESSIKEIKKHSSSHTHKHHSSRDDKHKTVSLNSKSEKYQSLSDHSSTKHKDRDSKSPKSKNHTKVSESTSKLKSIPPASSSLKNGEYSIKKDHTSSHSDRFHHNSHSDKSHHSSHSDRSHHNSHSDKSHHSSHSDRSHHSSHSDKSHHSSQHKEKHGHEDRKRRSSHHSDRSDKHSDKHKSSKDKDKPTPSKKKRIAHLDVDLFGTDSDSEMINYSKKKKSVRKTDTADLDLDSDLEKYFSDEDPFDECLRIFNEQPTPSTSSGTGDKKKSKKAAETEIPKAVIGKKRVALKQDSEDTKRRKVESDKPKPKPSPAQVMMNRYKMMQERALQAEEEAKKKVKEKVREISAQNKAKAATQTTTTTVAGSGTAFNAYLKNKKTTAITATKGQKRKAHTPTVAIEKLKRPVVEVTSSSKVGANIRQRYLNLFIDECIKLCPTEKEAFDRGKEEEQNVYKRCTNKKIYLNICVNTIKRLRNEVEEKKKKKDAPKAKTPLKLSHSKMLDGAHAKNTNYTVNRSGGAVKLQEEDFLGAELYKRLKTYILTEEQLKANNFPRTNPEQGGTAIFFGESCNKQKVNTKGYEKMCIRCGRIFEVYPNGKYPVKEECVYHWGKAWKRKIAGSLETRYTCCSGDLSSDGCQVAKAHVHETNKHENFTGYMKTIPCSPPIDGDYGVYALDCEMVYTTMGQELARVTVVGGDAEPIYESLVKPDNAIVDFNTRFSGITEDDMEDVNTSLRDVQAVLLSLFTDKTILMGHSLESDLTALKLIHSTVVDTSIVFPHRMGLPYKRALRNLMSEYLKKIIQDDVGGHDSLEDAVACIELMQFQLKEDARKAARRFSS